MNYKEVKADLFSYYDQGYYLVHCISADFKLGAGIAKEFEKRFNLRDDLLFGFGEKWWKLYDESLSGEAFLHKEKRIIDLITKTRYWHKPTMFTMRSSLKKMKLGCERLHISKLAMPKIGCGLDKLNWCDVSSAIKEIFADSPIEIVVCYL